MALKVIISGGGTGGHIFPAIAIANALCQIDPETEILFVGAKGKMEMEKVPAAGYKIVGLDIQGFQRKDMVKNLLLPYRVVKSLWQSVSVIQKFKPDVVVGVGGYASAPLLYVASLLKVPSLIQEQNSYAGLTNKFLGKRVQKVCVAFEGMQQFFPLNKISLTGNPIREDSVLIDGKYEEAMAHFNLSSNKKTILITGGSLGAATLNSSVLASLKQIQAANIQVIWQTGKYYYESIKEQFEKTTKYNSIKIVEFLNRMDLAYAAADVIISRAGAGTIAELCAVKKPVILVPSPNVTDDHQSKNAKALIDKQAAILVADKYAEIELIEVAIKLLNNQGEMEMLSKNIAQLSYPKADKQIALEVIKLANKK